MISLREDVITKDDKGNDVVVVSEITQESLDLDRRISSVIAEISLAKQEIDELIKKIRQLCREANELISNVLSFDGVDSVHISEITASLTSYCLGINSSDYYTNNSNNVVDWEFIPNYVFENGDIGNIIRVYLSNGKSYTVYMQTNGSYSGWDISGTKVDNLGGGCSIFAPSSVLSYMLGIDVFDIRQTIRGAGNFYGLEQLCHGKVAINVDGKILF